MLRLADCRLANFVDAKAASRLLKREALKLLGLSRLAVQVCTMNGWLSSLQLRLMHTRKTQLLLLERHTNPSTDRGVDVTLRAGTIGMLGVG